MLDAAAIVQDRRERIRALTTGSNGGRSRGQMTLVEFAEQNGLSLSHLSKFCRGGIPNPRIESIQKIDAALLRATQQINHGSPVGDGVEP